MRWNSYIRSACLVTLSAILSGKVTFNEKYRGLIRKIITLCAYIIILHIFLKNEDRNDTESMKIPGTPMKYERMAIVMV